MYYQSRSHTSHPVADAREAVALIHSGRTASNDAYIWKNQNGHRIALVDDSHIDHPWGEVSVINVDTREQYESITFAWCNSEAEKLGVVLGCQDGTSFARQNIILPLDGAEEEREAHFTCGCCGEVFRSTIAQQKRFDQDAGYGICPKHAHYYEEITTP